MGKNRERIFSQMIDDMHSMARGEDILDTCVSLNQDALRHVPMRYRIIALAFAQHLSLDTLNRKLEEQGCPRLYSRSFWEATLIFAFINGYSYSQWKMLQKQCADIYDSMEAPIWFRARRITYAELERYVHDNSEIQGDVLASRMQTASLEEALKSLGDVEDLRTFLADNIRSFSVVREKTRYYFCKYLYYWLNRRIENYFTACQRNCGIDDALSELLCLKVVTALRRNQTMPEGEKRELIHGSAISCSEVFDAFNYFYFGYVSVDWVEALIECYDCVDDIPTPHRKSLAGVFRKGHPDWRDMDDEEVIRRALQEAEDAEDRAYSRDGTRGYGKKRDGENALYKYIQGSRDIDRTVLICFLLFFASDAEMPDAHRLTEKRLRAILLQCGYGALDLEDDFDWFVMEYLDSPNPKALLTDVMLDYAKSHRNSFLYHVYGHSVQYEEELATVMLNR